jgi:hypothetical protein
MCKRVDLDHFDEIDDAVRLAAMDVWEYEMEAILEHEPRGSRTFLSGNRKIKRRKDDYSFKVLWKDIPQDENNPTWEPWSNESLRGSHLFEEYCRRPEVVAELGADFALEQDAEEGQRDKRRRH